jgi:hypothetical protein
VRQTLDYYHLSEHLYGFAHLLYPRNPAGAKAWVDQKLGALLTDRIDEVLGALKRMRPWKQALCDALAQWTRRGVRCRGGCVQARHAKSLRAGRHALEATRFSQRPGMAARPIERDVPGLLGQPWARDPDLGMTYGMKAHP